MSYKVKCSDLGTQYGPFLSEGDAYKYAGLLDLDPACRDTEHEVDYFMALKEPEPMGELFKAIKERIIKEAIKNGK